METSNENYHFEIMSDRGSWDVLCSKCEQVYEIYGEGIYIPLDPGNSPLVEFDSTQVQDNVFHFVVYILWLKQQFNSFESMPPSGER